MKIHGDMISPYVRMCFVTAHEVGLADAVELVAEDVTISTVNRSLEALSPIAQIPVLVGDDGLVLHDSRVIVDYLCRMSGKSALLPQDGRERHRILTLQAICVSTADAAVSYRNEVAQRPPQLHWDAGLSRLRDRVEASLSRLDSAWNDELSSVTAGSIAAAVVLSYLDFRFDHWSWRTARPRLSAFHQRFSQRPSMRATELTGLSPSRRMLLR